VPRRLVFDELFVDGRPCVKITAGGQFQYALNLQIDIGGKYEIFVTPNDRLRMNLQFPPPGSSFRPFILNYPPGNFGPRLLYGCADVVWAGHRPHQYAVCCRSVTLTNPDNRPIAGSVGADFFFRNETIEIDYAKRRVRVFEP
jgi:hypothetical protein